MFEPELALGFDDLGSDVFFSREAVEIPMIGKNGIVIRSFVFPEKIGEKDVFMLLLDEITITKMAVEELRFYSFISCNENMDGLINKSLVGSLAVGGMGVEFETNLAPIGKVGGNNLG